MKRVQWTKVGALTVAEVDTTALIQKRPNYQEMTAEAFAGLQASMERSGVKSFLLVREDKTRKGVFEVLDGHHRWDAAERKGIKRVPVVLWDGNDADAGLASIAFNLRAVPKPELYLARLRELSAVLDPATVALHTATSRTFIESLRVLSVPGVSTGVSVDQTEGAAQPDDAGGAGPDRSRGAAVAILLPSTDAVRALLARAQAKYNVETSADAVLAALRDVTAAVPSHNVDAREDRETDDTHPEDA